MKYLRKIEIFFYFIKNIFKIHNDHYASYKWRDYSILGILKLEILGILKLENLKFIRRARIHYWQNKASKYRPFTPFLMQMSLEVSSKIA